MTRKKTRFATKNRQLIGAVFVVLFGSIGAYLLFSSHAEKPHSIIGFGGYSCRETPRLATGSTGACVRALQYGLNNWNTATKAGLPALSADGQFDDITSEYVKYFQEQNGLLKTGITDQNTWNAFLTNCGVFETCDN